uniref:hypothetical protein n=1 Tax=Sulfuriferula sp. GW6 TaxID=3345112 RepID=UPI0039F66B00
MRRKAKDLGQEPSTGRTSGNHLVDSRRLLVMLQTIARHGGVGRAELREAVGVSRSTLTRLITVTRAQFGVDMRWRIDRSLPAGGEYYIADWGIFDAIRVLNYKPQ